MGTHGTGQPSPTLSPQTGPGLTAGQGKVSPAVGVCGSPERRPFLVHSLPCSWGKVGLEGRPTHIFRSMDGVGREKPRRKERYSQKLSPHSPGASCFKNSKWSQGNRGAGLPCLAMLFWTFSGWEELHSTCTSSLVGQSILQVHCPRQGQGQFTAP